MKQLAALTTTLLLSAFTHSSALSPMIDCAKDAKNLRCVNASVVNNAGTIGSGPAFYQGGTDVLRGGFVTPDGKTLIVAVETLRNTDQFGAVMAVDLDTGDRRLISGNLNALERRGQGVRAQGDRDQLDLYSLGDVRDVKALPDGSLVASTGQLIRIDPATGNRTLLWTPRISQDTKVRDNVETKYNDPRRPASGGSSAPATPGVPNATVSTPVGNVNVGGFLGGLLNPKPAAPAPAPAAAAPSAPGNGYFCTQADAKAPLPAIPNTAMHVDAQGNIYLLGSNNPLGSGFALFKLDARNDYRCTSVSRFDTDGNSLQGSGVPWTGNSSSTGPIFGNFAANGTTLYASGGPNPNFIVVSVDTQSGERRLISGQTRDGGSQVFKKGQGDAYLGSMLAFSGGNLYTTQEQIVEAYFSLVKVDLANGNRSVIEPAKGTPLATGRSSNAQLYAIPNSDKLLVWFNSALHVLDPKTGSNFILSR